MPYFVVILEPIAGVEPTQSQRQSHHDHLSSLKARGILFASGRFKDGSGGLYILEAKNIEEARSIVESDPYVKFGLRKAAIKEWDRVY